MCSHSLFFSAVHFHLAFMIKRQFPLSVFVFIDSFAVSALQDAGGYAISRQNNLQLHLGCHSCWLTYFTLVCLWCGWTVSQAGGRCTVWVLLIATILFCLHAIAVKKRIAGKVWEVYTKTTSRDKQSIAFVVCYTLPLSRQFWETERRSNGWLALAVAPCLVKIKRLILYLYGVIN